MSLGFTIIARSIYKKEIQTSLLGLYPYIHMKEPVIWIDNFYTYYLKEYILLVSQVYCIYTKDPVL